MTDLVDISNGKYKLNKNNIIGGGAFSKIYSIDSTDKNNNHIVKIHNNGDKNEAINEIEVLLELKNNRKKFKDELIKYNIIPKSKLITLKDYYLTEDYIYTVFKKYICTIEDFNIKYNKFFNSVLPIPLIKKFINSLFIGLFELYISGFIHSDIKPDNIMISIKGYNNINTLFKDIKKKKLSLDKLISIIDIKIIDFNKTQKQKSIFKSTSIQTLYYTPPEIILGNRDYNYSVDLWAACCIIHEISTSLYLFDVFNNNNKYKLNFKEYNKDDESDDDESEEESEEEYDENEDFEQFALLHIYKNKIGNNDIQIGKYVNTYYSNGQLMGEISNNFTDTKIIQNGKTNHNHIGDIINFIYNNKNSEEFVNKVLNIFIKVFIYDYNKRLTIKDIISKYMF